MMKYLKQDSRCPGRDSNRASPKYKSGGLPPDETNLFGHFLTIIREESYAYKILVAKPEMRSSLGRQWRIQDNNKTNLK
jgi:hypothetical protein